MVARGGVLVHVVDRLAEAQDAARSRCPARSTLTVQLATRAGAAGVAVAHDSRAMVGSDRVAEDDVEPLVALDDAVLGSSTSKVSTLTPGSKVRRPPVTLTKSRAPAGGRRVVHRHEVERRGAAEVALAHHRDGRLSRRLPDREAVAPMRNWVSRICSVAAARPRVGLRGANPAGSGVVKRQLDRLGALDDDVGVIGTMTVLTNSPAPNSTTVACGAV